MTKLRLHVVSLPHTQTTAEYVSCAYTQKVVKFCRMMMARGHEVVLYSGEENEAPCTEHVAVITKGQQAEWFGAPNFADFYPITWQPTDAHWRGMNAAAVRAMRSRVGPADFLCLISGWCQQQIAEAFPAVTNCEFGVGYEGIFSKFCAFESYSHMHTVYRKQGWGDGRFFDRVIPNYFDPAEFEFRDRPDEADPYLLYVGRIVQRKGVAIAAELAKRAGMKLKLAGQGVTEHSPGRIVSRELTLEGDHLEYVGTVDTRQRSELMGGATALLAPTTYIEPFGGVAVEAMMCGTPVIATDWGAFVETVPPKAGVRMRLLRDGVEGVETVRTLDRYGVRAHAMQYSLGAVAPLYERWFDDLLALWGEGWYSTRGQ